MGATRLTYLDHAATTPVRPEVAEALRPWLGPTFGNASSAHRFGRTARVAADEAKRALAAALGAEPNQVIFTSGGTEADNLAVVGAALAARERGDPFRVAVSAIEHKAVLEAAHWVTALGGETIVIPVTSSGLLDEAALDDALRRDLALVSVMWANNEVGVLQPVGRIAARCRAAGVAFHSDAVQAFGRVPVSLRETGLDLLSISGHKIGAPQGIGALIVRERRLVAPLQHGGGQQYGLRPGTENVPGIVALGRAAELAAAEGPALAVTLARLRDLLECRLRELLPDVVIHAEYSPRAPHIASFSVPGTESDVVLMQLDLAGVACSAGSACSSGTTEPSHVLAAMEVPEPLARAALRVSLGHDTTAADVAHLLEVLPGAVTRARALAAALQA